ncbi:uncharacterized protein LOC112639959 [Camponotus floridanus]|uniref:uncharacterized protein LOC112639959 n=1 Tax=Camponotus floridanus TaxID=104421 RepID=UPI000DC67770|nr:uncharacterized protein LOC112639958 isoform X1 [Camponotus floridanus]XP_025271319.1 uncharacterized protein LOC112639959 [Camponotus floridanus]
MPENIACSSNQSIPVQERKKKGLSKQNALYSVVKFNVEFNDEENETYSVIPTFWLKDKYTYWPKKDVRKCIIKRKTPHNDWTLYPVTIIGKYDSYEQALQKEKMMDDKNTESENNLGRGFRQKKLSHFLAEENDNFYCGKISCL